MNMASEVSLKLVRDNPPRTARVRGRQVRDGLESLLLM
jgi:hypothetical protein